MSTIKTRVRVNSTDFFAGYLEEMEDPIYHALSEMHDLLVLEKVDAPDKEKTLEDLKLLVKILINNRKKLAVPAPKLEEYMLIRITPVSDNVKKLVNDHGDVVRVGKIGRESVMLANRDCDDIMSDLGNFRWGSWAYYNEFTYEVISEDVL